MLTIDMDALTPTVGEGRGEDEMFERECAVDDAWFVLYVRSGSEDKVLRMLRKKIDVVRFFPFIPTRGHLYRGKGAEKIGEKSKKVYCFPGYVFFQVRKTDDNIAEFYSDVVRKVERIDGAFFFLYYGDDKKNIEMRSDEKMILRRLMNDEFCIEPSVAYKEGDKIRVISGPLMELESCIKRVNRHKREVVLLMKCMGDEREMTLGMEFISKI